MAILKLVWNVFQVVVFVVALYALLVMFLLMGPSYCTGPAC
jgi:hypothetical protein